MADQVQRLCRAAQQGDERAASELVKLCHQRTYSYLRRLCDNDQDAEDLTQETFAKVWLSLSDYHGRCAFLTWVHRIAHNAYVDCLRRRDGVTFVSTAWWEKALDHNPGPFENAARRNLAERVYALVDGLDEGKKQVVHLH
jgi:RNA polymerase sigma-70 factor (ECF subfamily)